jgi:hypothetical protein
MCESRFNGLVQTGDTGGRVFYLARVRTGRRQTNAGKRLWAPHGSQLILPRDCNAPPALSKIYRARGFSPCPLVVLIVSSNLLPANQAPPAGLART